MVANTLRCVAWLLVLAGTIVPAQRAVALDPGRAITQYVHSAWSTDDGLPQSYVTRILETSDGYLWVGTQAGVARFDGVRFTVFDHTNTPALRDDYIADLVEDTNGTLWIATLGGGVTTLRDGVFSHVDGISNRGALTLAADASGNAWVGGYDGLYQLRDGVVLKHIDKAGGLADDWVQQLLLQPDQSLWISTATGVQRLVDGRLRSFSRSDGLPDDHVLDMQRGVGSRFWVRGPGGIAQFIDGRFSPLALPGFATLKVRTMRQDRDGMLWLATSGNGLLRVHGGELERFTSGEGLGSDMLATLLEDRAGNLWIGSDGGGLERLKEGAFTTYTQREGLSSDHVASVIQASDGDIWVATNAGANRLRGAQVHQYTTADGLPSDDVFALWEDHARQMWAGGPAGVAVLVDDRFVPALQDAGPLRKYMVTGIFEDAAHTTWFSTRGGGAVRITDGVQRVFDKSSGLRDNYIFALAQGPEGWTWVGTTYGLDHIVGDVVQPRPVPDPLANVLVVALHVDPRGVVWVGSNSSGLFRVQDGRTTRYTIANGLPDDAVNAIVDDAAGNLWIGSNKGIYSVTRAALDAVASGSSQRVQPIVFGKPDGLKSSETSAGSQPPAWRALDGRLWFATVRGVSVVDPARIGRDARIPIARVEELRADERAIALVPPARLPPGTGRVEIRYTAPSLSSPERTAFRYRLDGYDTHWIDGSAERIAQYTNLPPGPYTFHVSASDGNGQWGADTTALAFELLPRMHQTWWFRLLCLLGVLAAIWGLYRLRVNWLHARTAVLEERQRIAGEIHDSLAQGLSGIIFQTEAALLSMARAPERTTQHIESARELAKSSLDDARYSVWNLNAPQLEPKSLVESLSAMAHQLAGGRVDAVQITTTGTPWALRTQAQHEVVLFTQEAISNAIRHGKAQHVAIDIHFSTEALALSVQDDGIGFIVAAAIPLPNSGYGLQNMHRRADRLGARIDVRSEVGTGTRIALAIPRPGVFARAWRRLRGSTATRIDA